MGVDHAGGPLTNEKFSVVFNDESGELPGGGGLTIAQVGEFRGAIFLAGNADGFHRAKGALRIARGADERAQFHQGLV